MVSLAASVRGSGSCVDIDGYEEPGMGDGGGVGREPVSERGLIPHTSWDGSSRGSGRVKKEDGECWVAGGTVRGSSLFASCRF